MSALTSLFTAAGLPPRIDYIPMPAHLKGKYQYYTQASMGRLRAAGIVLAQHQLLAISRLDPLVAEFQAG